MNNKNDVIKRLNQIFWHRDMAQYIKEAEEILPKLNLIESEKAKLLLDLGIANEDTKAYEKGLTIINKALDIAKNVNHKWEHYDTDLRTMYSVRGRINYHLKNYKEAFNDYSIALSMSTSSYLLYEYTKLAIRLSNFLEAKQAIQKYLEISKISNQEQRKQMNEEAKTFLKEIKKLENAKDKSIKGDKNDKHN